MAKGRFSPKKRELDLKKLALITKGEPCVDPTNITITPDPPQITFDRPGFQFLAKGYDEDTKTLYLTFVESRIMYITAETPEEEAILKDKALKVEPKKVAK